MSVDGEELRKGVWGHQTFTNRRGELTWVDNGLPRVCDAICVEWESGQTDPSHQNRGGRNILMFLETCRVLRKCMDFFQITLDKI